jgi:hypothetical protein
VPRKGVVTKETFMQLMVKAFRVFDPYLWILLLLLNVVIGWVDSWMNKDVWQTDMWSTFPPYKKFKVSRSSVCGCA